MATSFGPTALATPANGVTIGRILATPVVIALILSMGTSWPAVTAWFVLSCTDGVDGWLARRQGTTRSGAFLDPLADKCAVLAALAALVVAGRFWWLPVVLIGVREVAMSGYRSRVARQGVSVPARPLAKAKTVVQDLAVGAVLLPATGTHPGVAVTVLWAGVTLAWVSFGQYLWDGRRVLTAAGVGVGSRGLDRAM